MVVAVTVEVASAAFGIDNAIAIEVTAAYALVMSTTNAMGNISFWHLRLYMSL